MVEWYVSVKAHGVEYGFLQPTLQILIHRVGRWVSFLREIPPPAVEGRVNM